MVAERADPAVITDARLQQVLDLAREVTARHDLADVLATTLTGLRRLLTFGGGSIQLLDEDGWISMAAADPPAPEDVMAIRIPLGASAGGRVILTERPVYLPDVRVESDVPSKNVTPGGIRSYFGVPLMADGQAVGLVQLDSPEANAWSEGDRVIVMCAAPAISAAITNARAAARRAEAEARLRSFARLRAQVDEFAAEFVAVLPSVSEHIDAVPSVAEQWKRIAIAAEKLMDAAEAAGDTSEGPGVGPPFEPGRGSPSRQASTSGPVG